MTRLIDADALRENFSEGAFTPRGVREIIDNAPTVEPQKICVANFTFNDDTLRSFVKKAVDDYKALANETPHGKWILKETDYDDGGNNLYECTNCHHSDIHSGSIEVPYCWHCGADMRGGRQ